MKVLKRFCLCFFILSIVINFNNISSGSDFWEQSNDWFNKGKEEYEAGGNVLGENTGAAQEVIEMFKDMVNIVGTTVIVLITIFLGIKYIFGSFEEKGDVKVSLMNLLIACVFFFGWNSIWNILFPGGNFVFGPQAGVSTGYTTVLGMLFDFLTKIANFLAIAGVIYVGVRYIFAGAQGKSDLKSKSGQFIIGIIMAFCSVGFLNYISKLVIEIFQL